MPILVGVTPVQSVNEMRRLAADQANEGKTFEVTKAVFDHFARLLTVIPNTAGDIQKINQLLGTNLSTNTLRGMTRVVSCPNCGHQLTFADHIESALSMGVHSADEFRAILSSGKKFLTVDTDKPREVLCLRCNQKSFMPHCCYVDDNDYAYVEREAFAQS